MGGTLCGDDEYVARFRNIMCCTDDCSTIADFIPRLTGLYSVFDFVCVCGSTLGLSYLCCIRSLGCGLVSFTFLPSE
jgi:hypothetical protein